MKSLALSLVFSTLFIGVSVGAATTISSNITTGGNLTVSGTVGITGLTTMVYASSTGQSLTGNLQVAGGAAVGSSVTNSLAGTILLAGYTTAAEPTGVTQGTFYYNSTDKVLKMFDGTNWFTVGTTTSGISLSGSRLQFATLATQYLTLGTTTQQASGQGVVTLEATTTTAVPLSIVGYSGQTGHLLDVLSGTTIAGPKLLYISSSGGLFASSTGAFGGTLTVGGELTATSTLVVSGRADLNGQASTTRLSVFDTLYVGGTSTTTITGNNTASTIAYASTTAITNSGTASTSALIVGGNSINGTLSGLIFGTCDLQQTSITASTTRGVQCTTATGVSTAYKVFVMATSSLTGTLGTVPASNGFVIVSASSTAANVIGVELSNLTGAAATPAGTLNFWAVR
ncbi:MAG: hypothetical protein UY50_C0020G0006 [Parcubacteria group bacterium GW2011_GWA2_49_9]|nr:MAG: hypothetical protein UY50_C0020G0006 [Parcubacteria group bacterium GW2011_GWA2_49_9]